MSGLRNRRRVLYQRPSGPPRLNRDSPQARGLVDWLPFNGSLLSAAPGGLNSSFVGAASHAINRFGQVVNVTGSTSDYINLNRQSVGVPSTNLAVSFWINVTGIPGGVHEVVDFWGGVGTASFLIEFSVGGGGATINLAVHNGTSTDSSNIFSGPSVFQNIPTFITVAFFSNATATLWQDGIINASGNISTTYTIYANAALNRTLLLDEDLDADIWDFTIHNLDKTVLTAEQLHKALYNPATRWDLYWRPRLMVPGFVAGTVANPKGPLGMPFHGPFGGPVG